METAKNGVITISQRSKVSWISLVLLLGLTWYVFSQFIIPGLIEWTSLTPETATKSRLKLWWMPLIWYPLIGGNVCLAVNVFKPLKSPAEPGLVRGFVGGIGLGVIASLIIIIVWGYIAGYYLGPAVGLVMGVLDGVNFGFLIGLIMGLFYGIHEEFN